MIILVVMLLSFSHAMFLVLHNSAQVGWGFEGT